MPRRADITPRPLAADPVHSSTLVTQFINAVMLDGKRSTAERLVYDALAIVSEKTGKGPVELTAPDAAPILVVGTTRDPATPLAWAEALASTLESGVLVRRDGDGHTGYGSGNDCVDETVEKYLVSGEVPDGDVDC